jgi:hypothetical protein
MDGVMKWPRAKGIQAAVAFVVALLSAVFVFLQFAMQSFNNFYFPPHKSYPYPYPTEWAARIAMWRNCGLTFLVVFAIIYMSQRRFITARRPGNSNRDTTDGGDPSGAKARSE